MYNRAVQDLSAASGEKKKAGSLGFSSEKWQLDQCCIAQLLCSLQHAQPCPYTELCMPAVIVNEGVSKNTLSCVLWVQLDRSNGNEISNDGKTDDLLSKESFGVLSLSMVVCVFVSVCLCASVILLCQFRKNPENRATEPIIYKLMLLLIWLKMALSLQSGYQPSQRNVSRKVSSVSKDGKVNYCRLSAHCLKKMWKIIVYCDLDIGIQTMVKCKALKFIEKAGMHKIPWRKYRHTILIWTRLCYR